MIKHVRTFPWAEAPPEFRQPFGRRRRGWIAHVPEGCTAPKVRWDKVIEEDLDGGGKVLAGDDR